MTTIYIDEAGRGPLAGPVSVGVIMQVDEKASSSHHFDTFLAQFDDSKKLSEKRREELYDVIDADQCFAGAWAFSSAKQIDRHGIILAQQKATLKALWKLLHTLLHTLLYRQPTGRLQSPLPSTARFSLKNLRKLLDYFGVSCLSLDGNHTFGLDKKLGIRVITTIKGDSLIPQISMASILAKVARDRYMKRQARKYKQYGFAQHKGYGTLRHRQAIAHHGPCPLHRRTFIQNIISSGN